MLTQALLFALLCGAGAVHLNHTIKLRGESASHEMEVVEFQRELDKTVQEYRMKLGGLCYGRCHNISDITMAVTEAAERRRREFLRLWHFKVLIELSRG